MLNRYVANNRSFEFVTTRSRISDDQNIFTVIVGKNGTGKSRLLRSVAMRLIAPTVSSKLFVREEQRTWNKDLEGELDAEYTPSKVICVSTSPFDRFPLPRRDSFHERYSYLGLRGLPSASLGIAYLTRIVSALIGAASRDSGQAMAISQVLDYLGYDGGVRAMFQLPPPRFLADLLASGHPHEFIQEYLARPGAFPVQESVLSLRQLLTLKPAGLAHVLSIAKDIAKTRPRGPIEIAVHPGGLSVGANWSGAPENLVLLASSGLLRLKELILEKRHLGSLRLHEASSGEQAVVMSLLGIGSQITDGALVCIDEPEVCLHPEWQERYIELLFHTFKRYRGCHFLIATHSPQIVAQLPRGNCYVMAMEDGLARRAERYASRSIDFQLAEVFNAPGYKNEYLNRVALNAFARISKNKLLDNRSLADLATLRKVFPELRNSDPLRDLISTLEEMAKTYG